MRRYTENGIGDPERFYDPKSGGYRRAPDLGTATRAERLRTAPQRGHRQGQNAGAAASAYFT